MRLAAKGRGTVEPNPMVGALIVRDGRVVGKGWHRKYGGPHAEIRAIRAAGAPTSRGATLYVTLEPCTHFGKTPPCVDAIIKAGVRRVVIATRDPFPEVRGKGVQKLKRAGVHVIEGVLAKEARKLNAGYFKRVTTGMPRVIAKWAMTLDGKIAAYTGDSRGISSRDSLRYVHLLRSHVDAVIVGINTVLADDPLLTARYRPPRGASPIRSQPLRVILDANCRLPLTSRIVQTARRFDTLAAVTRHAPASRIERLAKRGVTVRAFGASKKTVNLRGLLKHLGTKRGLTNVLIEGGSEVLADAFEKELVDEVRVIVAPKILGGADAVTPVGGKGVARIVDALRLAEVEYRPLGPDILITGWTRPAYGTTHNRKKASGKEFKD